MLLATKHSKGARAEQQIDHRKDCRFRKLNPGVSVVQAAQDRLRR
jgi:hypothetical protein